MHIDNAFGQPKPKDDGAMAAAKRIDAERMKDVTGTDGAAINHAPLTKIINNCFEPPVDFRELFMPETLDLLQAALEKDEPSFHSLRLLLPNDVQRELDKALESHAKDEWPKPQAIPNRLLPGGGFVVAPNDPDGMVRAIIQCLEPTELCERMGAALMHHHGTDQRLQDVLQRWSEILRAQARATA